MGLEWKVVELSSVTDDEIERVLNEWTPQGWTLETIQFAMRESSKRPAMAFIAFTREMRDEQGGVGDPPAHLRPVGGSD